MSSVVSFSFFMYDKKLSICHIELVTSESQTSLSSTLGSAPSYVNLYNSSAILQNLSPKFSQSDFDSVRCTGMSDQDKHKWKESLDKWFEDEMGELSIGIKDIQTKLDVIEKRLPSQHQGTYFMSSIYPFGCCILLSFLLCFTWFDMQWYITQVVC